MYLETMDNMYDAQALYRHVGFELLDAPLGDTGHFSCPVQMYLEKLQIYNRKNGLYPSL